MKSVVQCVVPKLFTFLIQKDRIITFSPRVMLIEKYVDTRTPLLGDFTNKLCSTT